MIRVSTAATTIGIAAVAAVVSYRHAYDVVMDHGEPKGTAVLVPLCVDGLVYAAGMVHLDSARRGQTAGLLAWAALGLGIGATIAVNVLHGLAAGPVGAVVAAWPAVTLVLVVELLMGMIRQSRDASDDATPTATPDGAEDDAPHTAVSAMAGDAADDAAGEDAAAPRAIAAPKPRTTRATRRATPTATDRTADALAVLATAPDISGAELGRRLGLSPRQGQRLLGEIRAADPMPGQTTIPTDDATDDATDGTSDTAADRTADEPSEHDTADDTARLVSVGGEH
ncbi:DUF2637 domain-containing protein [Actinomadura terrae]|uniref:DUF2637 domain-containing protein n=1 Tax=Actinomadura terrae TaxID=604353 RepID=UPI001FA757A1|nr:DUF2637 domain-containing protein [Actinomadura terrae]